MQDWTARSRDFPWRGLDTRHCCWSSSTGRNALGRLLAGKMEEQWGFVVCQYHFRQISGGTCLGSPWGFTVREAMSLSSETLAAVLVRAVLFLLGLRHLLCAACAALRKGGLEA